MKKADRIAVSQYIASLGYTGMATEIRWNSQYHTYLKKQFPDIHEVLCCPKIQVPLYIENKLIYVSLIAKWRLDNNK